jgi:hypothetical protein
MGALIDRRLRRVRYTKCARGTSLAVERAKLVERQIELEHIRARLADEAGEALLDALLDERAQLRLRQAARGGDRGDLRQRELRGDVRIEAGGGGRRRIRRDDVDSSGREFRFDRGVDALHQRLRGGAEIGHRERIGPPILLARGIDAGGRIEQALDGSKNRRAKRALAREDADDIGAERNGRATCRQIT